jgi:hypothetical protein
VLPVMFLILVPLWVVVLWGGRKHDVQYGSLDDRYAVWLEALEREATERAAEQRPKRSPTHPLRPEANPSNRKLR